MIKTNPNRGSTVESFLEEKGLLADVKTQAIKDVLAWQIASEMKRQNLSKDAMSKLMKTSRAQLDRLLDPTNEAVTLRTLQRAADVLGKQLRLELV